MKRVVVCFGLILPITVSIGCSASKSEERTVTIVQDYYSSYRQLPPEPVYSRLTWSHLPQPIRPKSRENAPILMPEVSFELPKSNLEEAIQALAQTIGYDWSYPAEAKGRPIAINMVAPVDKVLKEIGRQADVVGVIDHQQRVVRVVNRSSVGERPVAFLPNSGQSGINQ